MAWIGKQNLDCVLHLKLKKTTKTLNYLLKTQSDMSNVLALARSWMLIALGMIS